MQIQVINTDYYESNYCGSTNFRLILFCHFRLLSKEALHISSYSSTIHRRRLTYFEKYILNLKSI
jgi:hypothetical protein